MSIVNATWGGAAFVLVPLISFITLRYGWRTAAIVAGGLVMSTAIPAMLVIRRSPESMGLLPDGRAPSPENTVSKPGAVTATPGFVGGATDFTVGQAVRTRAFWLLVVAANLRMMTYSPILVHFVPLLVWKGLSQQGAANLIGLWSLLVIPASLIVGYVGDRWNKRVLLSGATLVGAVAFLVLGTFHHPAFLYLFLLLLAPFDNLGVVNWSLLGEMFGRKNFATLRGIIAGVGSIGAAASPVYAGLVWDKTGGYTWALVPFAGALVVSAVIYVFLPRPKVLAPAAQPVAEKTPTP
ncbi:MAG: MFS transporter, partial [Chloroflexi bacterium]|nr:MFS transporter [Chloroflexota bacterium]